MIRSLSFILHRAEGQSDDTCCQESSSPSHVLFNDVSGVSVCLVNCRGVKMSEILSVLVICVGRYLTHSLYNFTSHGPLGTSHWDFCIICINIHNINNNQRTKLGNKVEKILNVQITFHFESYFMVNMIVGIKSKSKRK